MKNPGFANKSTETGESDDSGDSSGSGDFGKLRISFNLVILAEHVNLSILGNVFGVYIEPSQLNPMVLENLESFALLM